jgi:peptidase M50-like protein
MEALESQEFAQERLPFRHAKRYCPACHKRFYHRVNVILALVPVVLGVVGIVDLWRGNKPFLHAIGIRLACLLLLQWLMVVPHELGHAVVARSFGYKQIRILVGTGRALFSVNMLGFTWLFNLIPLGGLTFFNPGTLPPRWKRLAVVAAGPMVNLLAGALALLFLKPGWVSDGISTWPGLFVWANLLVLVESLIPYVIRTPFGATGTDGLQLWHLLFRWNKPISSEPEKLPFWELVLCYGLKWLILLITLTTCLLLGFFAVYISVLGAAGLTLRVFIGLVVAAISLLCGWITVRIAVNPIARLRKRVAFGPKILPFTAEQIGFIKRATEEFSRKDFAAAEKTYDSMLALMPARNSEAFVQALLGKVNAQVEQGHIERAEKTCLDFIAEAVNKECKLKILDGFACLMLYRPSSPWLKQAEKMVRLGLELAPGTLTLKGTLGGILAEQGDYTGAEPLLRECLERSPAYHDQGISSFYLGVIKLDAGKSEEGKRLIKNATTLYAESWLVAKANAKLKEPGRKG